MRGIDRLRQSLTTRMSKTAAVSTLARYGMTKEGGRFTSWLRKLFRPSQQKVISRAAKRAGTSGNLAGAVEDVIAGKPTSYLGRVSEDIISGAKKFAPAAPSAASAAPSAASEGGRFARALPWLGGGLALGGLGYGGYQLMKPEPGFFERIGLGFDPSMLQQLAPVAQQFMGDLHGGGQGFGLGADIGLTPESIESAMSQTPEPPAPAELAQEYTDPYARVAPETTLQGLEYYGEPDYSQFGY